MEQVYKLNNLSSNYYLRITENKYWFTYIEDIKTLSRYIRTS